MMTDDRETRVRNRAHSFWEASGHPEGRALDHWLQAEAETDDVLPGLPDDVDRAAGPSHGDKDFGGHDAESEGSAAAGVGGQQYAAGEVPRQAGTDEPETGEHVVRANL